MLEKSSSRMLSAAAIAIALVLGAQVAVADSADEYLTEAREFVAKGQIKSAVIQLKNALQTEPSNIEARLMLGSLYLRTADGAAAAKEFGRARDLGANNGKWMPGYAKALILNGEYQAVLDEIEVDDSLGKAQQAEMRALRGNANLALRRIDQAVQEYDAALLVDGGNPMARLGKAQILIANGKNDEALEQLNQVLVEHPGHVEVRLARGDILRRKQKIDDAQVDYERAVKEAPANPRGHIGLAMVHIAKRDVAAAKKELATINKLTRNLPAVSYLQALVSFQEKDYERASDELQALLRVAPGNLQANLLYGIVSYAREQFTIADDYLTRVLASAPGNVQVVKLIGAARLKLRQPDRAVKVLSTMVDPQTEDAQLLALLGTAYIQSGDNSRGAEYIERAVKIDPDQALLRTQLAVGKIATGDTTEAISQLESAVALGQDVVQADVLLVLSYLNKKEFAKAIAASEALEKRMSDSPIPYNLTGLAFLAQRRFDDARARFHVALNKDPKFLVAQMNLARLALAAKDNEAAGKAYREVLDQEPKHVGALMGLAALARMNNDAENAEKWLLRANDANPQALQPMLVLAEIYLRQNQGLKAVNLLSSVTPQQADLAAVQRLKGMAQLQSGDYSSAVHTLRKLTEAQPGLIEGWFQLARAQAAADDVAGSRASFQKAIELDSAHAVPVVWVGLAELELRERRYDEALKLGEQMKQYFPATVFGDDVIAAAYSGKGQSEPALAAMEKALRRAPTSRRMNNFVGTLARAGQVERAAAELAVWLKDNPKDGPAWANLGMMRQQLGQDDAALTAYEKSLELANAEAVVLNNMAWLYLERGSDKALEMAKKAYELAPSRGEIVDTYGWVLFKQGRQRDGLAALQQALVISPRNAEIGLHVAEALITLKRGNEARPMLQRIVREHPSDDFGKSARKLLERISG